MSPAHIMIIEDDNATVAHMVAVMKSMGFDVAARVASGKEREHRTAEERKQCIIEILQCLNKTDAKSEVIRDILQIIKGMTGFEAVGIRLREKEDFPYFVYDGFPEPFIEAEKYLCARDPSGKLILDAEGNHCLECMCGNILCGRTDPSTSFFTEKGSFWTNCTTELLATTSEKDRQARTMNRCNGEGYESVALVPLRSGDKIIGLLQLNDRRTNCLTIDLVRFLEEIGGSIGIALGRKLAEEELRASRSNFDNIVKNSADGIIVVDLEGCIAFVNAAAERLFGHSADELVGTMLGLPVIPGESAEIDIVRSGKDRGTGEMRAVATQWEGKAALLIAIRDITANKATEAQLLHAQKMEAIGTLARGVAHDFNNILTGIQGFAELILMAPFEKEPIYEDLGEIIRGCERAAALTRQLLLFSRKKPCTQTAFLDINKVIYDLSKMLRHLISEDIAMTIEPALDIGIILADKGSIEQVVMNLGVNAADAMPRGGKLDIRTRNAALANIPGPYALRAQPGRFVCLSISDTGAGMSLETIRRIFEPFFTTKEAGKGTGLGLSIVFGIIEELGGFLEVKSPPGEGTTFGIHMPVADAAERGRDEIKQNKDNYRGSGERILLVEDEASVRRFAGKVLRTHGYKVFTAASAAEALELFEEEKGKFHLVFSDVVLPGQSGVEMAEEILRRAPAMPVVFASGYAEKKSQLEIIQKKGFPFLQKPYTIPDMLEAVKKAIGTLR